MGQHPVLQHLSIGALIAAAGGDPWHLDDTIQAGDPGEIDKLAQVFHGARANTAQADAAFVKARQRFEHSWNRQTGAHPINDSAEVRSVVANVKDQIGQLDQIAADLEAVAASLAETQRFSALDLQVADGQLRVTDALMGPALAAGQDTSAIEKAAEAITKEALDEITAVQNTYKGVLARSVVSLRSDGYDPADLSGIDEDKKPTPEQRDHNAVNQYGASQRAKDDALVNSPGPMTPEKADAAARLRDYASATDPAGDPMSRHLASERLEDYHMAHVNGPLFDRDPVTGATSGERAKLRLDWQKKLESGLAGPPMTPDEATAFIDNAERIGNVTMTQNAIKALQQQGMSQEGARRAVGDIVEGKSPWERAHIFGSNLGDTMGSVGRGLEGKGAALPSGGHWGDAATWSKADAEALESIGKRLGVAGIVLDIGVTVGDIVNGDAVGPAAAGWAARTEGGLGGGALAAWGAGFFVGPEGVMIVGALGALGGSKGADWLMQQLEDWTP